MSSNNDFFSKFAAGNRGPKAATENYISNSNSSGGDWLSTKKRGRDDAQIARDRTRAKEAQRAKRGLTPSTSSSKKAKQQSQQKDKKRDKRFSKDRYNDDDDDDEDLDGFIARDSEEEYDEELLDEDYDEKEEEKEEEDDDEESSDGGETSFFQAPGKKRTSRPPNLLKNISKGNNYSSRPQRRQKSDLKKAATRKHSMASKDLLFDQTDHDDSNEEIIASPPERTNGLNGVRRKQQPQQQRVIHQEDYDDDDDDDDDYSLGSPAFGNKTKATTRKKSSSSFVDEKKNDSSDSEDELQIVGGATKRNTCTTSTCQKRTSSVFHLDNDSDDSDGGLEVIGIKPSPLHGDNRKKQHDLLNGDDTDDNDEVLVINTKKIKSSTSSRPGGSMSKYFSVKNEGPTEEDKLLAPVFGNSKKSCRRTVIDDDDSDDDSFPRKTQQQPQQPSRGKCRTSIITEDDFMDDDEAVALGWAMEESDRMARTAKTNSIEEAAAVATPQKKRRLQKMGTKSKALVKKSKKKRTRVVQPLSPSDDEEEEEQIIEIEEEEEEGDDDEIDAYVDAAEREAGSVLQAANELSAQVLKNMMEWSGLDTKKNGGVPQGIIVDGALALTSAAATSESSSKHKWISQELMHKICPGLKLADYQLIGVNWLALLHGMTCSVTGGKNKGEGSTNVNGVLADEMGLGKTVQTIAFLAWLRHHNRENGVQKLNDDFQRQQREMQVDDEDDEDSVVEEDEDITFDLTTPSKKETVFCRPHIIIVPASVLSNWEREFRKFCPDMKIVKYHGSKDERLKIQARLRDCLPRKTRGPIRSLDVVLTTFSYFSSEKSDDRNFLRKFCFDYMVVDEAHCLKNPRGMRYRNMDKFVTSHRMLLTGTPVQNAPKELMSLLCFLMPFFSSRNSSPEDIFEGDNKDVGEQMLSHFVTLEGSKSSLSDDENAYKRLKQLFAPFVLRRRKSDVLGQIMPPKTRKIDLVPFDEATQKVYDGILSNHLKKREKGAKVDTVSARRNLFVELRKAANHPLLLRTRHTSDEAIDELAKKLYKFGYFGRDATCTVKLVKNEIEKFSDLDIHKAAYELIDQNPVGRMSDLEQYILDQDTLFCSPKFTRLRSLLPELIADGHRILIFSQWTKCLDLLESLLECLDLDFLRLDGQTSIEERQGLIDDFNSDPTIPVFLLSTRAGGMGINLTAADTCILHDLDFNPFNDIQAEDRCHRIGQKKPVTVIKMVTEGTVDADIYAMQERKAKMNAAIMEESGAASNQKKKDDEAINGIVQNAVDRFMSSPRKKGIKV